MKPLLPLPKPKPKAEKPGKYDLKILNGIISIIRLSMESSAKILLSSKHRIWWISGMVEIRIIWENLENWS